jgi:hypothetical protein
MCAEVLSWREETWWERKSIPLGSHSLSPRQLILLVAFGSLGDLISMLLPLTFLGILYLGRILPVLAMLAIGVVLGSQRIRMIPVEVQIFYRLSSNKNLRAGGKQSIQEEKR